MASVIRIVPRPKTLSNSRLMRFHVVRPLNLGTTRCGLGCTLLGRRQEGRQVRLSKGDGRMVKSHWRIVPGSSRARERTT